MKHLLQVSSLLLFLGTSIASAATWVDDPNDCPETFESQNCLFGEKLCGYDNNIVYCYDNSTIVPPSSSTTSTTRHASSLSGGFLINCEGYDSAAPFCNNNNNTWCNADPSCSNVHRETNCTSGTWGAFSCGSCQSGYTYCDGSFNDADGCEVNIGSTPYPGQANARYHSNGSCTPECNSGYQDCDGDLGTPGGTGCEIQQGATCTTAAGATGKYNGCSCVPESQFFETGVDTGYGTTDPLLWGTQFGAGPLANLERNGDGEFIIDMDTDGNVTFQDAVTGPIKLSDLGGGSADNLGDHTATQGLDLTTFTLIGDAQSSGASGSTGLRVDADGNIAIGNTAGHYFGEYTTDGTWRLRQNAGNFVFEKRESGSFVEKGALGDDLTLTGNVNIATGKQFQINGTPLSLDNLSDVDTTGTDDKKILQYSTTTSNWVVVDGIGVQTDQGLEINAQNKLGLLQTCGDGQILQWDDTTSVWECGDTTSVATLVPYTGATSDIDLGDKNLTTTGNITAGNLNISDWDTAFSWGNHATVGYLTNASNVEDMATLGGAGTVPLSDGAGALTMTDVVTEAELTSEADLEAQLGGLNVLTVNDSIADLSDVDTTGIDDNKVLKYSVAENKWIIADDSGVGAEVDPTVNALGKAPLACADNEIAKWDTTSTTWECQPDKDNQNWATVENGSTIYMNYQPNDTACQPGEILSWNDDINGDAAVTTDDIGWVCSDAAAQDIEDLSTQGGTGTVAMSDGANGLSMVDVIAEDELTTEADLETQLGGLDVLTANDGALTDDDLSDNTLTDLSDVDTSGVSDGQILRYATASSSWIIGETADDWGDLNNDTGVYMDYQPNDTACQPGEILSWNDDINGDAAVTTDDIGWVCSDAATQDIEDLSTQGGTGTVAMSDGANGLSMVDVIAEDELTTETDLETQLGGLDVLTANDGALTDDDLSDNTLTDLSDVDTSGVSDGQILRYATASSSWIIGDTADDWGDLNNDTGVYMDYQPNNTACPNGGVLKYTNDVNGDSTADDPGWICGNDLTGNTQASTAAGQMLFANTSGTYEHSDTSELYWDDTGKRLGIGTDSPQTTFHVEGGVSRSVRGVNDQDTSALANDYIIAFTALTQARTVTLPNSLCTDGRLFVIKDESGQVLGNNIVITPETGTQIDGDTSYEINRNYNSIDIYCHNGNWFIK